MWVQSLGWEDPLEEGMATHFSILAWRIPWTEEPGGTTVYRVAKSWIRQRLSTHVCNTMMEFCYNEYSSGSQTGTLLVFCCKIKIFIKSLFADRNNPVGVEKLTM